MTRTAIIIIARESDDAPEGLAALLPVVGRPLVEHQVRRALRAGADEVLLVAERYPPPLADAVDRMRDDGLRVRVAATAADAAIGLTPSAPLLLVADGTLPGAAALAAMLDTPALALAVLPDGPGLDEWERIDAATRWAGLARLDGDALVRTAEMLGEWDLELTLVRRLVGRAPRLPLEPGAVVLVSGAGAARDAGVALTGGRHPIDRAIVARLAESRVEARWLRDGAIGIAAAGAALAAFGPAWAALAALAAAWPLDRLGRRLADARLDRPMRHRGRHRSIVALFALALGGYALGLSGRPGWEPALLSLATVAFMLAAHNQSRLSPVTAERWAARPEWMLWAAALPVIAGRGMWALGGLALWSAAGLFVPQWRALRPRRSAAPEKAADPDDQRLPTAT